MSLAIYLKPPAGYREKTVVVDGKPHKITVRSTIAKAKAFLVTCQAQGFATKEFVMDGPNGVSKARAIEVAGREYRTVHNLKANVHVNVTVAPITAKVGASA